MDRQVRELTDGVEFFVGTTGRVLDHISKGTINFEHLKAIVLDEADMMLDMGFKEDVEKIIEIVQQSIKFVPQYLLFSATVPAWVKDVARRYLAEGHPVVDLCKDLTNKTVSTVQHLLMNVRYQDMERTLVCVLKCYGGLTGKAIVFTETKADCNNLWRNPRMKDLIEVMHGDIAQIQRETTLKRF